MGMHVVRELASLRVVVLTLHYTNLSSFYYVLYMYSRHTHASIGIGNCLVFTMDILYVHVCSHHSHSYVLILPLYGV